MYLNKYWNGIREGNEKSLNELFREINSSLYYYAYYITEDHVVSEEIVQDVFIKIWQDRNKIKINGSLKSYLYKATRNQSINHLIHKKTKKYAVNILFPENNWHTLEDVCDSEDYIIEKIEAKETENTIKKIIDTLPAQCRRVFLLSRFEEKSNPEIAIQLKISVNTVKTHIYKALDLIKKELYTYS